MAFILCVFFFLVFFDVDQTPDLIAFGITLLMTCVLVLGASKSVIFNNALNAINFATWVFIMTAGLFYIDTDVWHEHDGFLPFGWSGVSVKHITNICYYPHIHTHSVLSRASTIHKTTIVLIQNR